MTEFASVRVAAVQATPVILDAEGSIAKAVELIGRAAADGAQIVVLPETFVSLYPSNVWARQAAAFGGSDGLWERMWASAIDVPGPAVDVMVDACREHRVVCTIGVNERESERPGSLYNALLILGPEGLRHRHRKLMPTHHERLFHGIGAGDDLGVVRAAGARISVPQYIPASAFPDDFPLPLPEGKDLFLRGGAAVIHPAWGDVIAGPLYDQEGIVVADCDLRRGLHAKRTFDAVGHYSRADVLDGGGVSRSVGAAAGPDGAEAAAP